MEKIDLKHFLVGSDSDEDSRGNSNHMSRDAKLAHIFHRENPEIKALITAGLKDIDFSAFTVNAEEVVICGDYDELQENEVEYDDSCQQVVVNEVPIQSSLINTLACVEIFSDVFVAREKFQSFNRQHRVVYEIGGFFYDDECVDFVFPPVGYEWFTTQFRNSLGVSTPNVGLVALTTVSNIMYSAKILPIGNEFMVFGIHTASHEKYFLWSSDEICEVDASGVAYGIKRLDGVFVVLSGVTFSSKGRVVLKEPSYYMNMKLWEEAKKSRGLLCNINGVEYCAPTHRLVCLGNVDGSMCDASKKVFAVDKVVLGTALYEVGMPYIFNRVVDQRPDSTLSITIMKDSVVTLPKMIDFFKIPTSSNLSLRFPAKVYPIHKNNELFKMENSGELSFFIRSYGDSKNAAVCERVSNGLPLSFDQVVDAEIANGKVYIGNNGYKKVGRHSTLVVSKILREKKTIVIFSFYSNKSGQKIARRRCVFKEKKERMYYFVFLNESERRRYFSFKDMELAKMKDFFRSEKINASGGSYIQTRTSGDSVD